MDNRKIYNYHNLDAIDIIDSVEWARENFDRFDGEISPLWNEYVKKEFAVLNKRRDDWAAEWNELFQYIAADMKLQDLIDTSDAPFLVDADVIVIPEQPFCN